MTPYLAPLALIGRGTLAGIARIGQITLFTLAALARLPGLVRFPREVARAFMQVGWLSLPIVGLTAVFTGAALALQIHAGGSRLSAEMVVPQITAIGIVRELGPVMVGLMVAARVTASLAAEIATMKVTEQIDALVTLSTDPMTYITAPRVLAGLVCVPVLVGVGDVLGLFGGFAVATGQLGFGAESYIRASWNFLDGTDVALSLTKGVVFGGIATVIACHAGFHAGRGARGVGQAVKSAVQSAAILILAANVALTAAFFGG
ncbi:MAG TPA: ABC transporter permease [Maritimibacter sp.]|nr:ABC transporter permease [Maritimibacter sp.]